MKPGEWLRLWRAVSLGGMAASVARRVPGKYGKKGKVTITIYYINNHKHTYIPEFIVDFMDVGPYRNFSGCRPGASKYPQKSNLGAPRARSLSWSFIKRWLCLRCKVASQTVGSFSNHVAVMAHDAIRATVLSPAISMRFSPLWADARLLPRRQRSDCPLQPGGMAYSHSTGLRQISSYLECLAPDADQEYQYYNARRDHRSFQRPTRDRPRDEDHLSAPKDTETSLAVSGESSSSPGLSPSAERSLFRVRKAHALWKSRGGASPPPDRRKRRVTANGRVSALRSPGRQEEKKEKGKDKGRNKSSTSACMLKPCDRKEENTRQEEYGMAAKAAGTAGQNRPMTGCHPLGNQRALIMVVVYSGLVRVVTDKPLSSVEKSCWEYDDEDECLDNPNCDWDWVDDCYPHRLNSYYYSRYPQPAKPPPDPKPTPPSERGEWNKDAWRGGSQGKGGNGTVKRGGVQSRTETGRTKGVGNELVKERKRWWRRRRWRRRNTAAGRRNGRPEWCHEEGTGRTRMDKVASTRLQKK